MTIYERYFLIKQKIQQEEFRRWDAERNGCTLGAIFNIEKNISSLQHELNTLQQIRQLEGVS